MANIENEIYNEALMMQQHYYTGRQVMQLELSRNNPQRCQNATQQQCS